MDDLVLKVVSVVIGLESLLPTLQFVSVSKA